MRTKPSLDDDNTTFFILAFWKAAGTTQSINRVMFAAVCITAQILILPDRSG